MERKDDSAAVLLDGTGTPYLAVFNNLGEPIVDSSSGLPIGMLMTDFEYNYNEEKSDVGEFTLETDNPDLISHPALDFYMGLMLQWGWIYPNGGFYCSPVRQVVITEHKVDFTETGVKIRITFSDSSVLLKNQPADYYNSAAGFEAYVKDMLKGVGIGLELWDYSEDKGVKITKKVFEETESAPEVQAKYAPGQYYQPPFVTQGHSDWGWPITQELPQKPSTIFPNCVGGKLWEYTPETEQLAINNPDSFKVLTFMNKTKGSIILKGVSKNKYQQCHEICKCLGNGPYFVDSRDNKVFLHNAQTNRPVSKVYTYKGGNGELLQFQVSTSYARTSVDVSKKSDIDPDTGDLDLDLIQSTTPKGKATDPEADVYILKNQGAYLNDPNVAGSEAEGSLLERAAQGSVGGGITGLYRGSFEPSGWFARDAAASKPRYYAQMNRENQIRKTYPSIQAAKTYLSRNVELTEEEVKKFWAQMKQQYEYLLTDTLFDPKSNMGEAIAIHHRVGTFTFKRKVYIQKQIEPGFFYSDQFAGEDFINGVSSGEIELDSRLVKGISRIDYSVNKGLDNLRSLPDFKVIRLQEGTKYYESGRVGGRFVPDEEDPHGLQGFTAHSGATYRTTMATIQYSVNLDITIDGIKVMTDYPTKIAAEVMGQDLEYNQTSQIKAKATIVGDPCLESSMNIQIQNVSSKFEGVWYIKRISHKLSPSRGYTCDIEFVQRDNSITLSHIGSTIKTVNYSNIQEAAKKALETGSYKRQSVIEAQVKEKAVNDPQYPNYTVFPTGGDPAKDEDYGIIKSGTPVTYQKVETVSGVSLEEGVTRNNLNIKIK